MDLKSYRESRGLSQQAAASELGLKSKSYLSMLETGASTATWRVAIAIEVWSEGAVRAVDLLAPDDAHLLASVIERARSCAA